MMFMPTKVTEKNCHCQAQATCAGQEMGAPMRAKATAVCQSVHDKRLFSFPPVYKSLIQYNEVLNAF